MRCQNIACVPLAKHGELKYTAVRTDQRRHCSDTILVLVNFNEDCPVFANLSRLRKRALLLPARAHILSRRCIFGSWRYFIGQKR
jgi:hypothetical protein